MSASDRVLATLRDVHKLPIPQGAIIHASQERGRRWRWQVEDLAGMMIGSPDYIATLDRADDLVLTRLGSMIEVRPYAH